jgi:CTP:molybdopterin cytidylyltransferase MocA
VIAAVVLAAGASSRYGADPPKQAVLLPRVLGALAQAATIEDVVVVSGAHPLDGEGARIIECTSWAHGPGASLRCGLAALGDADAAVVALADGPDLDPRAVDRVVASWWQEGGPVVAASYDGVRLHPVLLAREAWGRIPDEGARALEARLVPCDDLTPPGDVDTREG